MEFVFVVPREDLFPDRYPQGLTLFGEGASSTRFQEVVGERGFFVERDYAERNPKLKQVIPYSIVVSEDRVLLLKRTRAGGEERLFDKLSIGVGGHINPEDVEARTLATNETSFSGAEGAAGRDPIGGGTLREISEELKISGTYDLRPVGIVNDDSNSVGAVHVGFVQVVTLKGKVDIRERDQLEGRLVTVSELATLRSEGANYETWSELLVDRLHEILPELRSATSPTHSPTAEPAPHVHAAS